MAVVSWPDYGYLWIMLLERNLIAPPPFPVTEKESVDRSVSVMTCLLKGPFVHAIDWITGDSADYLSHS